MGKLHLIRNTEIWYMSKDEKVHLWIGSTLKAKAQKLAQSRDQSLSGLIRYLLRRETDNE